MPKQDTDHSELSPAAKLAIRDYLDDRLKRTAALVVSVVAVISGLIGWSFSSVVSHARVETRMLAQQDADDELKQLTSKYEDDLDSIQTKFESVFERILENSYANSAELIGLQQSVIIGTNEVKKADAEVQRVLAVLREKENGVDDITRAVGNLESAKEEIANRIYAKFIDSGEFDRLSSLVPIGTVIAWPGKREEIPLEGNWRRCESGASAPYNDTLAKALAGLYGNPIFIPDGQQIRLPNFEGAFLRGLGGNSGQTGKRQSYATALPQGNGNEFVTETSGSGMHSHYVKQIGMGNGNTDALAPVGQRKSPATGSHQHTITSGGDEETRPDNYAVVWLIRVN